MTTFLVVHALLLAALASVATLLAWAMARWRPLMDKPNARSSHVLPTPRGGGIGIVVATLIGWVTFWSAGFASRPAGAAEFGLAAGAVIVALAGLADDRRAQSAAIKLGAQALAALVAIAAGLSFERVPLPLLGTVELGPLGPALTFVWLVGLTNAFNFMDGLDGLAASTAVIAAVFLALVAHQLQAGPVAALAWSLAAGSLGFLLLNLPPARIFMGDVGSQFLGFAFAGLGILLARHTGDGGGAWIVPLLLFHFLFDTAFTAALRARRGARLWEAHREHLYQRLNRTGVGHGGVTLILSAMALLNGVFAIAMIGDTPPIVAAAIVQATFTWLVLRREHAR
jgi:UDP-GlcNAc:undecaprenyl-phosphate/decaprenyl-phosphate GlcNAc-1-phosphate transferase